MNAKQAISLALKCRHLSNQFANATKKSFDNQIREMIIFTEHAIPPVH